MASAELTGVSAEDAKKTLLSAIDEYFDDISEISQTDTDTADDEN